MEKKEEERILYTELVNCVFSSGGFIFPSIWPGEEGERGEELYIQLRSCFRLDPIKQWTSALAGSSEVYSRDIICLLLAKHSPPCRKRSTFNVLHGDTPYLANKQASG